MVVCNLCGWTGEEFRPRFGTEGRPVVCPECGSLDRNRHLWCLLGRVDALRDRPALLDIGPSPALTRRVEPVSRYVSIDLQAFAPAVVPMDLRKLEFPDDYFHVVLCADVLEHIRDDTRALREIFRVLRPDGCLFLRVPHKKNLRARTDEWPEPDQHGHWRRYGARDIADRLTEIGFGVTRMNLRDELPENEFDRAQTFVARKPSGGEAPAWEYSLLEWMARRRLTDPADAKEFVHKPISS
jgi:SAM-dependent methyltransferase